MSSPTFDYSAAPVPVPDDIVAAHERAWDRLRQPGNWWTGSERVELAAEARGALDCELCRARRAALSPEAVAGAHRSRSTRLPPVAVDAAHRVVTDAPRLSRAWLDRAAARGLSDGHYVELLGVVVTVLAIDELHRGLGVPLAPLPEPGPGQPSRERPAGLVSGVAWVPMLPFAAARGALADLYEGMLGAPNVFAALSLVPDAARQAKELAAAHYLPQAEFANALYRGRALSRAQIELVAARVSSLNQCFY